MATAIFSHSQTSESPHSRLGIPRAGALNMDVLVWILQVEYGRGRLGEPRVIPFVVGHFPFVEPFPFIDMEARRLYRSRSFLLRSCRPRIIVTFSRLVSSWITSSSMLTAFQGILFNTLLTVAAIFYKMSENHTSAITTIQFRKTTTAHIQGRPSSNSPHPPRAGKVRPQLTGLERVLTLMVASALCFYLMKSWDGMTAFLRKILEK
jgi:hypothetical protein